jgi:hypothetical protein
MKRFMFFVCVTLACAGIGGAAYRSPAPPEASLSKFVPAGPRLYLEAKDFSSLLDDWNSSAQKKLWVRSDNYEIFARSRLFLRLKAASDQFAAAAGLPPDMDFLSQISGQHSVLALYDVGKLQFLYIAYLPSAKSMRSSLWKTRASFEPRNAGGVDFYLRRDPESQREVEFAVAGDYLLLATREGLIAGALQLMAGKQDRTVESESWWAQSTASAKQTGDLRMVLDLQDLVSNGYFRTYWVQQNITDLSQYSAAVADLFRSGPQYREERTLIRKKEPEHPSSADALAVVADLARLVPDDAGVYVSAAHPTGEASFTLLETKLLAPHLGSAPASQLAPHVQLTSGEQGASSDLETRIDVAPGEGPAGPQAESALARMLQNTPLLASLQVQSSQRDAAGVFVQMRTAVVLAGASEWNESAVQSALAEFVRPGITASQLGVGWMQKPGYQHLDGLWPLAVAVRGRYLVVSDDPAMMESVLANFARKSTCAPADLIAGFSHRREHSNFVRFASLVDRANATFSGASGMGRQPQFFSGNVASLSSTLANFSAERIEIRSDGNRVQQTVSYEWSQ